MSVDLVPSWKVGSVDLTSYPYAVDADSTVDIGEPEMVVEGVTSNLADGDIERVVRHGNRTYVLEVVIEGATLGDLAKSEALLRSELRRKGLLLAHNPGDGFSPTSAYEVQTAQMTPRRRDDHESHLIRKFVLTLKCSPFARSESATVAAALPPPGSPVTTSINTADTTTGWSAADDGYGPPTITASGGAVTVTGTGSTLLVGLATSVSFTSSRYLTVEVATNGLPMRLRVGTQYVNAIVVRALSATRSLYVFDMIGFTTTLTSLSFEVYSSPADTKTLVFYDVSRTTAIPQISNRQISRVIDIGGTERTPGSLRVGAPNGTSPLGLTLVSTWPDNGSGFAPPLRRWRTSGNTETVDTTTMSGKRETLGTSFVQCDIPIASLPPGTYQLMALMRSSVVGNFTVEASIQSRMNGVTLGETPWSEVVNFPVANDWKLVPMGVYGVPIVAAKAGEFRIIFRTPSITTAEYDEAWLFPVDDDCALTSALVSEPYLWLDSPNLDSSVPHVLEGTAANKSDAHWPRYGIHTMGNHVFSPPRTAVFTATLGVENPDVSLTYYKRWHSNAAED